MVNWIKSFFQKEIELTVWFHSETVTTADGVTTVTRKKKVFNLGRIIKITPTHIIAEDMDKKRFEVKTIEPFDYLVRVVR